MIDPLYLQICLYLDFFLASGDVASQTADLVQMHDSWKLLNCFLNQSTFRLKQENKALFPILSLTSISVEIRQVNLILSAFRLTQ